MKHARFLDIDKKLPVCAYAIVLLLHVYVKWPSTWNQYIPASIPIGDYSNLNTQMANDVIINLWVTAQHKHMYSTVHNIMIQQSKPLIYTCAYMAIALHS